VAALDEVARQMINDHLNAAVSLGLDNILAGPFSMLAVVAHAGFLSLALPLGGLALCAASLGFAGGVVDGGLLPCGV
jgi:hypothetical protein